MNFDWFKYTALDAVQHAANTFLTLGGGDAFEFWHLDVKLVLGASASAAVVSVLRSIVAYKLPASATDALSASTVAAEATTALRAFAAPAANTRAGDPT